MKKGMVVIMAMAFVFATVVTATADEKPDEIVKAEIRGWDVQRTGIFGDVKSQCEQFVSDVKEKIAGKKARLVFIIPGYADPTGPGWRNDNYGLLRAYNVGEYIKSEFSDFPDKEFAKWSGGEMENKRAVEVTCRIIFLTEEAEIILPSAIRKLLSWYIASLLGIIILAILALLVRRRRHSRKKFWSSDLDKLAAEMKNPSLEKEERYCPFCQNMQSKIRWANLKRHVMQRCPKFTEKDELNHILYHS